ncbi:MAG: sigma 54-interacting transcriptional regulator, partial [Rhodothermales bacterium]|nr:sigma 54-interacting transcriptional regulator [Rhodothermales bacterium]
LQTSLLRVLQAGEIKRVGETHTRTVDVRVISATNRSLDKLIQEGAFRQDLYYRLYTIALRLPPLRERRTDVPLLAHHFLDRYATGRRAHIRGFTPEALRALQAHSWPGNVRELENTIERAVVMAEGGLIRAEDLRLPATNGAALYRPGLTLKDMERRFVLQALEHHEGNISETARVLGVSRRWLHYRLKQWQEPDE